MTGRPAGTVRIGADRCGPSGSGNGGWTAGVLAAAVSTVDAVDVVGVPVAVTVTLRRPPPLGTDLRVEPDTSAPEHGAQLLAGPDLVAEAVRDDEAELGPVDPVDAKRAAAAERAYAGLRGHPFPRCFVCGTEPGVGVGLALRPGPVTAGRTACTWLPHAAFADGDGTLAEPYLWAALDCPGGWTVDLEGRPMVLGRITARLARRARADERLVVVGRHVDTEGRKTRTATTVYDASGAVVGAAAQLWISVDPATFAGA